MSRLYDINGLGIVIDRINFIGRVEDKTNDLVFIIEYGARLGKSLFCLPIYFHDLDRPLLLADQSADTLHRLRQDLVSAIEDKERGAR
jgi:hypothetical protein